MKIALVNPSWPDIAPTSIDVMKNLVNDLVNRIQIGKERVIVTHFPENENYEHFRALERNRLDVVIDLNGVQTYRIDEKPFLEIHPVKFEYEAKDGQIFVTAVQNFKDLRGK